MLDATRTLMGTFGKLHHEGEWLTNVTGIELNADINYEEVPRAGTRVLGHKAGTIVMEGTIQSYKVTPKFVDAISQILDDKKGAFVTELMAEMDDPENPDMKGFYRVKGVQFKNIPILSFEHGSIVEEELQFVFTGYERM
ncbi:phage tail tube protein [Sporosarcina sp. SAFN-015]|uniref:phage tail tube protein n=1 Tax=Sporosarcina sp. SAFN-015 TaxID=3387274 RepID=UPI003F7D00CC